MILDEIPSPQRLPEQPPTLSIARLRQLAADRRREAKAMEKRIPPHDVTARRFALARVTTLREEANAFERQAEESPR